MSNAKHTPGPFVADHNPHDLCAVVMAPGANCTAREIHNRADADLFAASPDMLSALLEAEYAVQELCEGQDPANECWAILGRIRAAIAKTTGGA